MKTSVVRIGIAGCGMAARIHLDRLLALDGVAIVGCADPDPAAAAALADRASIGLASGRGTPVPAFTDHRELLRRACSRRPGDFQSSSVALSTVHGCAPGGMPRIHREAPVDEPARGGRYRQPGPRTQSQGRSRPSISPVPQPDRGPRADRQRRDRPAAAGDVHSRPALVDHARRGGEGLAIERQGGRAGASSPMPAIISSTPCSGLPDRSPTRSAPFKVKRTRESIW